MLPTRHLVAAVLTGALLAACSSSDSTAPTGGLLLSNERVSLNPSGYAPLSALIHVETSQPTTVALTVAGRRGAGSEVTANFTQRNTTHDLPVLGLYPDFANTVTLTFRDSTGVTRATKTYSITTAAPVAGAYPAIAINARTDGQMAPGMTLVSYFGYATKSVPQKPFIFDAFGDVRWSLDFTSNADLANLFFDNGIERLRNGNLYFGDGNSGKIYEVDMLGRVINTWPFAGYTFHHEVLEKPNGNFLVTVTKQGIPTIEDFVIEIDRTSKQIVRTWDLRQSLQFGRRALTADSTDWIHVNAVAFDSTDNTIIISGRTQGVIKLDSINRVVWILGSHRGWGTAGNGVALAPFLLNPLDRAGQPITDPAVRDGTVTHPDFEWNWYQHAPLVMPNGHVMLFDNGGDNRNYSGSGRYSRAVEYEINTAAKTVRQAWSYGTARGVTTFSNIVSDVDFLAASNHVLWVPGAVNSGSRYGKVIELDYATQSVVFEATLTPVQTFFGITMHRAERLPLYP